MTIIGYLYSGRNTWLRCSEDCICDVEDRIKNELDQIPVELWIIFDPERLPAAPYIQRTADEWNEICGPAAEQKALNEVANRLMSQAADYMAAAATKERLSGE